MEGRKKRKQQEEAGTRRKAIPCSGQFQVSLGSWRRRRAIAFPIDFFHSTVSFKRRKGTRENEEKAELRVTLFLFRSPRRRRQKKKGQHAADTKTGVQYRDTLSIETVFLFLFFSRRHRICRLVRRVRERPTVIDARLCAPRTQDDGLR